MSLAKARQQWKNATVYNPASAAIHIQRMLKELEVVRLTIAAIPITNAEVEAALVAGGLNRAMRYWISALANNPAAAAYFVLEMDKALTAVGKTRADIDITDAEVEAVLVDGRLLRARQCWDSATYNPASAVIYVGEMDAILSAAQKTRADIDVTDEEVAAALATTAPGAY